MTTVVRKGNNIAQEAQNTSRAPFTMLAFFLSPPTLFIQICVRGSLSFVYEEQRVTCIDKRGRVRMDFERFATTVHCQFPPVPGQCPFMLTALPPCEVSGLHSGVPLPGCVSFQLLAQQTGQASSISCTNTLHSRAAVKMPSLSLSPSCNILAPNFRKHRVNKLLFST